MYGSEKEEVAYRCGLGLGLGLGFDRACGAKLGLLSFWAGADGGVVRLMRSMVAIYSLMIRRILACIPSRLPGVTDEEALRRGVAGDLMEVMILFGRRLA
jgi:hypothetical protein